MAQFMLQRNENPTPDDERLAALENPVFGKRYTDHMVLMAYTEGTGWHDPRIAPMQPFQLHPAAAVLHYAQEIFEGLKAYRHPDDSIWLFRPDRNAARFVESARRVLMEPLPEEIFLASIKELVALEQDWVPQPDGEQSLYIRPFQIADEAYLGVREAHHYTYSVITTPVGAYYPAPVRLWVTSKYKRAAGTGQAKCGGNYAASLLAAREAADRGCSQVLYTDAAHNTWIEECGTMNFMMVTAENELVTPALGNILAGVTRESLLAIASDHGLQPVERQVSVEELFGGLASGQITELLACGTAAVITPIVGLSPDEGENVTVGDGNPGPKTQALRQHLLGIQYGHEEDKHGWLQRVV